MLEFQTHTEQPFGTVRRSSSANGSMLVVLVMLAVLPGAALVTTPEQVSPVRWSAHQVDEGQIHDLSQTIEAITVRIRKIPTFAVRVDCDACPADVSYARSDHAQGLSRATDRVQRIRAGQCDLPPPVC